jgi:hypothetical protein
MLEPVPHEATYAPSDLLAHWSYWDKWIGAWRSHRFGPQGTETAPCHARDTWNAIVWLYEQGIAPDEMVAAAHEALRSPDAPDGAWSRFMRAMVASIAKRIRAEEPATATGTVSMPTVTRRPSCRPHAA